MSNAKTTYNPVIEIALCGHSGQIHMPMKAKTMCMYIIKEQ